MKNGQSYCAYFCEENIYKLLENNENLLESFVLVISNEMRQARIWKQSVVEENEFVVWDYHVILVVEKKWVYDFDTRLEFPCDLKKYLRLSFKDDSCRFLMIRGRDYVRDFYSDRSHMLKAGSKDEYVCEIPDYECIQSDSENRTSLLMYVGSTNGKNIKQLKSVLCTGDFYTPSTGG